MQQHSAYNHNVPSANMIVICACAIFTYNIYIGTLVSSDFSTGQMRMALKDPRGQISCASVANDLHNIEP